MCNTPDPAPTDPGVPRVARVYARGDEPSDVAYWLSRPPAERLAAVETLRRRYYGWTDDESIPRLQRVCRVVDRT